MKPEENPILNNPYEEPLRHYAMDPEGNMNYEDVRKGRRLFTPDVLSLPQKRVPQISAFDVNDFEAEYGTHLINLCRKEVSKWRAEQYQNTTRVTKELLSYWFLNEERNATKQLFFAQREAIETAIWLNEVAEKSNAGNNILNRIKDNQNSVSDISENRLPRIAFKMATGSGKTVVMAGLILYHYFNRQEYRHDTRFADYFLIVAPGITIKDRLSVLRVDSITKNPIESSDYYNQRALVPPKFYKALEGLNARLIITNYHNFEPKTLQGNKRSPFDGKIGADGTKQEAKEDFSLVIKRVLGKFKAGSRLLVINDEAHHCYLPKEKGKNTEEENSAEENARAAVWFTGVSEIGKKFQVRSVYDLSATPYYLTGSGYAPYSLFPWVVSDFGLIDAIESGLVKIPFLPEGDNTHEIDTAKLRNLYDHVKTELPRKGQRTQRRESNSQLKETPPHLPTLVQVALDQFVDHYNNYDKGLRELGEKRVDLFAEPPVFIVVCNNTSVSKEVYKAIAGYEFENGKGEKIVAPGKYDIFSNYNHQTLQPLRKPPTLLIDSDALENSNQVNVDFKKVFAPEIANFKKEYRITHPEKSVENLTDADILREVVNTVGKRNALGSHIRCVVSVSMLTEGWDANTVTHIMGLRAFGSQLLCEQVAGRALRRRNYFLDPKTKKFPPEYAHIIGIPFKMFKGGSTNVIDPPEYTTIQAISKRQKQHEMIFPNLIGYRVETQEGPIKANYTEIPNFELDFTRIPVKTIMANAFTAFKDQMEVKSHEELRDQQVIFSLTRNLINHHFSNLENEREFQKFNKLKAIVEEWYNDKLVVIGESNPTLKRLVLYWNSKEVADHINLGILADRNFSDRILPVFNHYNKFGSTKYVSGNTSKRVFATTKSHVNYVVADTDSWEQICAKTLEELEAVQSYAKNAFLGCQIPYVSQGKDNLYFPDFIAHCKTAEGKMINLIIEITGMNREKQEKKWYVKNRWLPAVNNVRDKYEMHEWHFIEIANDIRNIKNQLMDKINSIYEDKSVAEPDSTKRVVKLKQSFGTIKSNVKVSKEALSRENLYGDHE